jgi:hypothetical protein
VTNGNKRMHPQMHASQEGPPAYLVNLSIAGNYLADAARVMCKTLRAGLASRELTLEGSKDMCDFIAKALDETERAVRVFDDFKRGHSGKSPDGDISQLQAEIARLRTELNVANAIIHDMTHGISAAQIEDMRNVLKDIVQVGYSGTHSVSGDWFVSRELMKRASDAIGGLRSYTTGVRYALHIDRGPGFTHSEPAEGCGCRFIGGKDSD